MTLSERLRAGMQIGAAVEAADALDAKDKRIAELEGALLNLMPYWTHAWDLVEGGLFIDKQSVKKFDAAFQRARALLGEK